MDKVCCVFVCNRAYFDKFLYTCNLLITKGNYKREICLVIGDDLNNEEFKSHKFLKDNKIIVKYFPNLQFTNEFIETTKSLNREPHWFSKKFQYHKLYLFDTYFKNWDYIFYIDCGLTIFSDVFPMINLSTKNRILAHSDAYDSYNWRLYTQFDQTHTLYKELEKNYTLDIDYFQTTIMLYSTEIIKENTFKEIYDLTIKYPISITNDQGILSLYFTNIKNVWRQIKTKDDTKSFYDYLRRNNNNYIMLKSI